MAVIIATQKEIEEYYTSEKLNQSSLKNLAQGLAYFKKKQEEQKENKSKKDYFIVGSAVDIILTGNERDFENQYYVSKLEKLPSEAEINIIKDVFDELSDNRVMTKETLFSEQSDAILAAANEFGWQMRWKEETRINKLIDAGEEYFAELRDSIGKQIISTEMNDKIQAIVNSLRASKRTAKYFNRKGFNGSDINIYYQKPIYFTHRDIECKALLDIVIIIKNPKGEIIEVQIIDLKTTSDAVLSFSKNVRKFRYDIQAAWYAMAVALSLEIPAEKVIAPFKFIVESTMSIGNPLVFEDNGSLIYQGRFGKKARKIESEEGDIFFAGVKGFEELIDDYKFYEETGWKEDIRSYGKDVIDLMV